jgi:Fe-S-cluster containining protein
MRLRALSVSVRDLHSAKLTANSGREAKPESERHELVKPVPQIRVRHLRGASLEALKEELAGGCAEELLCTEIISSGKIAPVEIRATYQVDAKTETVEDDPLLHLLRTCAKTIRPVLERNRSTPGCDIQPYLPGHARFVCAQNECVNPCCSAATLQIAVSPDVQDAIVSAYGLPKEEFLTPGSRSSGAPDDNGFQILQAKSSGCCVFLNEAGNHCGIHEVRPDPCRMYPFELAFFQLKSHGDVGWIPDKAVRDRANGQTVDFFRKGELGYNYLVPLVMYHAGCPGLTGDRIGIQEYIDLVHELWRHSERMSRTVCGAGV